MSDLIDTISTAGGSPRQVQVDGQVVQGQPLQDLIAADAYLKSATAVTRKRRGLRFTRLTGPRQVDVDAGLPDETYYPYGIYR